MDQFLSKLLDKYGLARMVIAVLIGFIALWSLAHFTSAPGGNVSLFWGLVQYTKSSPSASLAISGPTNRQPPPQNHETPTPPVSLPGVPDDLGAMHGITQETFDATLQSIRTKRHLRPLEALESGRPVAETARGTYFFISINYLAASSGEMVKKIGGVKVNRFRNRSWYFEMHLPKTGAPIIVALTYESDAVRLDSPNSEIRRISVTAVPWEKMTSLVSLPADRVITAKDRILDLSEKERVDVLDIEIQ